MEPHLTRSNVQRRWLLFWLPVAGFVALAAALWLPFGPRGAGLGDEWGIYDIFDSTGQPFDPDKNFQPNRPFRFFAFWLGYLLTPNSFFGLMLVQIALLAGNGLAFYAFLKRLGVAASLAFLVAVLAAIYPADTLLFSPVCAGYSSVLFTTLLALNLLMAYWQRPRLPLLVGMWASLTYALGMCEVAYPLVAAAPALLFVLRRGQTIKQCIKVSLLWYLVPAVMGTWTLVLLASGKMRYWQVVKDAGASMNLAGQSPLHHLWRAYGRHFFGGWLEAFEHLRWDTNFTLDICIGTALIMGGLAFILSLAHPEPPSGKPAYRRDGSLIMGGLIAMALGFAPFMVSPAHYVGNERVFFFTVPGAALCVGALLHLLGTRLRWGHLLPVAIISVLLAGAMSGALLQQRSVQKSYLQEQRLLAEIAEKLPAISGKALLLIFDDDQLLDARAPTFFLANHSIWLNRAVSYLQHNPQLETFLWRGGGGPKGMSRERCEPGPDGVATAIEVEARSAFYSYDQVIAMKCDAHGDLELCDHFPVPPGGAHAATEYAPQKFFAAHPSPPPRGHTLFPSWPFKPACAEGMKAQHAVRMKFDEPVRGLGWSLPEGSMMWMTATTATVEMRLLPKHSYDVAVRVDRPIAPNVLPNLTLDVNGTAVPLKSQPDGPYGATFRGRIPKEILQQDAGTALLAFHINLVASPLSLGYNPDTRRLGLLFDWLTITAHTKTAQTP